MTCGRSCPRHDGGVGRWCRPVAAYASYDVKGRGAPPMLPWPNPSRQNTSAREKTKRYNFDADIFCTWVPYLVHKCKVIIPETCTWYPDGRLA